MRKVLVLVMCMWAVSTFAQDSTKCNVGKYVSWGLSLSNNTDFNTGSYSSLEFGLVCHDVAAAFVFGRGNLDGVFRSDDVLSNYFYEFKVSPSFPIGKIYGNIILGYGGYFNANHNFIEYGVGVSYMHKKIGYGVSFSNWDGVDYISPSISFNF
jgi:hypothetical protein